MFIQRRAAVLLVMAGCLTGSLVSGLVKQAVAESGGVIQQETVKSSGDVTELSLEQLMTLPITSVSKKSQKVSEAAAAISVLTQEDIRRSGATSIPELLRLVPGLDVAQINSSNWAVSARGFNGAFANKLLVLVDGRTVYTPLFAGVYWNEVDVMLEDIERIEVIRGPGATLWGANAVNGVINILSKSSKDTQGALISGGGGSEKRGFSSARYGGQIGEDTSYRVYGKYNNQDNAKYVATALRQGDANDQGETAKGGTRIDSKLSKEDTLVLLADGRYGREDLTLDIPDISPTFSHSVIKDTYTSGADVLARWSHTFSAESDLQLQMYYDRIDRDDILIQQSRDTMDLDFQHRFPLRFGDGKWRLF